MSSPDLPFQLRGGNDKNTSMHNRIAAVERIKFLSGIDLRKKSSDYLKALDLEMWQRWYRNEKPDKPIDEIFCRRAADVAMAMDNKHKSLDEEGYQAARKEHKTRLSHVDQQSESSTENAVQADQQKQN